MQTAHKQVNRQAGVQFAMRPMWIMALLAVRLAFGRQPHTPRAVLPARRM